MPITENCDFCDRLKSERARLGIKQSQLAELAGVSKNTALSWEKGATSPTVAHLEALAEHGMDLVYLVTGKHLPTDLNDSDIEWLMLGRRIDERSDLRSSLQNLLDIADEPRGMHD